MICHLVGTSDAVASAEKLINEVLAEAEAGASAGGGTRRMAAQSGGDEFSMQIPNNKITFNVKHQLRMEDRIWIQLQSGSEFRCGGFSENRRMYYLGFELISEFASVPNWGGLPRLILALLLGDPLGTLLKVERWFHMEMDVFIVTPRMDRFYWMM
ncbi:hypothetical protein KIW84_033885 [Lathyrus oleraceus]|uniref:Uncharacterized protein n=1 Tax=Pisum sativum TaxID=3888 RepID=A0A9D4XXU6_PEA|nr:hypothetical protein KIW84_033885 [Pisum sativum]